LPWFVYIVSNANRTLYAGITADPVRRLYEHRTGKYENAFTKRYNFDRMVFIEACTNQRAAAKREKQVKRMSRAEKVALIESRNPSWRNLADIGVLLALDDGGR
jgi:putative endonuclease